MNKLENDYFYNILYEKKKNNDDICIMNKYNTVLFKHNLDTNNLLQCDFRNSRIISCVVSNQQIKYLTYSSILTNICIFNNLPFKTVPDDNNSKMKEIIDLITIYDISFNIIIQLKDYTFIEYTRK
jgi:hypothetical protein